MIISINCAHGLLIEPVWNRNIALRTLADYLTLLLIEPVWNRNEQLPPFCPPAEPLLIEPVWNRNRIFCSVLTAEISF